MNKTEKQYLISRFGELAVTLDPALNQPEDALSFRPFPDAWTIKENIVHCLDFEVANFHRYRWAITNPGTTVLSFDQKWKEMLNYQSADISLCISMIKLIRKFMADHFRLIADDDWTEYSYRFNDEKIFNLEQALQHFNNHMGFHRELIERNIGLFEKIVK
jgi:hypothetical protein